MDNKIIKQLKNHFNESISDNKTITEGMLITNAILTSQKLISEIESLEEIVLSENPKIRYNDLLILGAKLELILKDVQEIKLHNLKK